MKAQIRGFDVHKGYLDKLSQTALIEEIRRIAAKAPMLPPQTPGGKPMSVKITSAGKMGWSSDKSGYHYTSCHPNGTAWPAIPETILALWHQLTKLEREPDCCLINYYGEGARMGMHQDRDEADFSWPVMSVSLGDSGLFRIGNKIRGGETESIWLESGDVVIMGGDARLTYHGVDRIRFGSSSLLSKGGRLNLTCRVVV